MIRLTDTQGQIIAFDPFKISVVNRRTWISQTVEDFGSWVRCDGDIYGVKEPPDYILSLVENARAAGA